ncbi:MAG TPA: PAS domain S-box protein [Candidatus Binataceae bacterium]|nr:PAS domain S-box protein [Candidatus Binataceae bacterium]
MWMLRGGGALMFVFQVAYLVAPGAGSPDLTVTLAAIHLLGVYTGALLFALSFTELCRAHWRIAAWLTCATEILSIMAIAMIADDPEALFVAIIAIVVGSGALAPWEAGWQAALGGFGLAAFAAMAHWSHDPAVGSLWLGVIIAVVLAQATVAMATRYRRELEARMAALRAAHQQLRIEMAERAEIERRHQNTAFTLRSVFENLNEIAIVGSLDDFSFVMVNDAFETAFGYRREQVIGRQIAEISMWVHAEQREHFISELRATREIRNYEAEFRLAKGTIITGLLSGVALELDGRPCGVVIIRDITAIREAHRRIESSENELRKILDACPEAVTITRARDSKFIYANRALLQHEKLHSNEILEHNGSDLDVWPDQATRREFARRIARDGAVTNMEVEFRGPRGRMLPTLLSAVQMEIGGDLCIVSFIREIIQIKQKERELEATRVELALQLDALRGSEARLAESEAKLRTIFNANPDLIAISSLPSGKYLEVNDEMVRRTGFSREQILGHHARDLGFWVDPAKLTAFALQLNQTGEVRNLEADLRIKSKSIPHLVSGVVIELGGRKVLLSLSRDISEFRAAQQRLADSEATLRKVFDANFDTITITDVARRVYLDVNEQFVRMTGMSKESVIGKTLEEVGLWTDPARTRAFVREVENRGVVRDMEANFTRADGSVAECLVSGIELELAGRPCRLAIAHDVTATKRDERELIAAREAALQALRAKSEFLSSMSHEIRTPMNAILGMADLLAETPMTTEQSKYVHTLTSNGNALLGLLNDILDMAKIDSGRMTLENVPFDLREVIEKSAEAVAIRAQEKGLELLVRIAPGTPAALIGDPLRMRQILINLIGNAIKFTNTGEVSINVEPDRAATGPGALLFSVRDTGVGIAPENLESIFMAFTQADSSTTRSYGGSGLGLAIVRRLATLMRGKVWARSELGHGSEFFLSVTIGTGAGTPAPADPSLFGKRVLVADDNPTCRAIVSEMLEAMGAAVETADSGTAALAALERARLEARSFDAIFIDNRMPMLSGIEAAQRMLAFGVPDRSICLMLGLDEISQVRSTSQISWIVKPVALADLRVAVERCINSCDPRPAPAPARTAGLSEPAASARIVDRPLRIMLADDSADNRILVRAYLKKTPYLLDEAENGRIAIDKFMSRTYDLILMDIQMPEVDGYTATRAIRQWERENNRPRTPILALTASALEENLHQTQEAGCDAHITKPVKKATLLEAIHRAAASADPTLAHSHSEKIS